MNEAQDLDAEEFDSLDDTITVRMFYNLKRERDVLQLKKERGGFLQLKRERVMFYNLKKESDVLQSKREWDVLQLKRERDVLQFKKEWGGFLQLKRERVMFYN